MVINISVFPVNTLAMVLCMQQSHNKASTSMKSTYISSVDKVSGLQLSQVIAGSFHSSSCSSQLQSINLLSFPAKPFPKAAAVVYTTVDTMTAALLAAVTMTMYAVCVQDVLLPIFPLPTTTPLLDYPTVQTRYYISVPSPTQPPCC